MKHHEINSGYSRRNFAKLSLLTLAGATCAPCISRLSAADAAKANVSKFAGVQVGMNVPYSFAKPDMTGEEILKYCNEIGIGALELRTQSVEVYMGAPKDLVFVPKKAPKELTAGRDAKLKEFRRTAPLDKAKAFRKMYEDAGVLIEVVKVDNIGKMSDDEIDYEFTLAKILGARAISTEMPHDEPEIKRLGQFADKHKFLIGYHGHASAKPENWERAFEMAKFNGANVDIGHFTAGLNTSPVPFLKKYHERVAHVHIKDRKFNNGPNTQFGQGDTPIVETLRLIRDQKWNIQATIEFEIKIGADANRQDELKKTIKFCKDALLG